MEVGPTRTCELLVGLPDVTVLAVDDQRGQPIRVHVEQRVDRPRCSECDAGGVREGPSAGRAGRLAVLRASGPAGVAQAPLVLPEVGLFGGSWTGHDRRIAAPRLLMTDRACRWATEQVGRHGRTVSEVAADFGCDWHKVNDAVIAYGTRWSTTGPGSGRSPRSGS